MAGAKNGAAVSVNLVSTLHTGPKLHPVCREVAGCCSLTETRAVQRARGGLTPSALLAPEKRPTCGGRVKHDSGPLPEQEGLWNRGMRAPLADFSCPLQLQV
jgi:hypothetical protein